MTEEEEIAIFEDILVEEARVKPMPMSVPVDNGYNFNKILKEFEVNDGTKRYSQRFDGR